MSASYNRRFTAFAWFFLGYLLFVIAFGAWVRISGSGNGCGNHWPLCNGVAVPQAPETKTIIEFSHRITSALSGLLGIGLLIWSRKISKRVFRAALAAFVFLLIEGFIGAVLVKKELVAGDASSSRAIVVGLHLANTLILTGCAATVAWWSAKRPALPSAARALVVAGLVALIITSSTGAVTALGDTLFPKQPTLDASIFAKAAEDLTAGQHFLVRLRIIHPLVAVCTAGLIFGIFAALKRVSQLPILNVGIAVVLVQTLMGFANIALAAPGWLQIVHLLVSQVVWLVVWVTALIAWGKHDAQNMVA